MTRFTLVLLLMLLSVNLHSKNTKKIYFNEIDSLWDRDEDNTLGYTKLYSTSNFNIRMIRSYKHISNYLDSLILNSNDFSLIRIINQVQFPWYPIACETKDFNDDFYLQPDFCFIFKEKNQRPRLIYWDKIQGKVKDSTISSIEINYNSVISSSHTKKMVSDQNKRADRWKLISGVGICLSIYKTSKYFSIKFNEFWELDSNNKIIKIYDNIIRGDKKIKKDLIDMMKNICLIVKFSNTNNSSLPISVQKKKYSEYLKIRNEIIIENK